MKKTLIVITLMTVINAYGDIEHSTLELKNPTTQEISKSRSCFEELKAQGCGDPGDDAKHFRSCMSNAFDSLTDSCKKMMTDLYGKK